MANTSASPCLTDLWTLPNGLRIVGDRLPYLRSVSIGVWLGVGSMMETPTENGLSHFLEHMVFKGTTHRTARQIAEEMDAVGGQLNAFTGKDCTCLYAKVIDEDLPLAVDILADMAVHATIDANEFVKERGVILEEIGMDEDSPEDLVHDLLSKAMFGDQSLGMPILGTTELVSNYSREDLLNYRGKHYRPENTVVSLSGNYDPDKVLALCEQYFGAWQNPGERIAAPKAALQRGQICVKNKDTEQLHLCLGFPGLPFGSESRYAQAVLSTVLGGSMSSRLFQRIREEMGMAYSIYSFSNNYVGCGTFGIYAGVSPKNGQVVLEEIRKELKHLTDDGITEKEFHDAKTQLRGGYLLGLESPGGRMQAMGRSLLHLGRTFTPDETIRKIESLTYDEVMDYARQSLTVVPCLSAAGKGAEDFGSVVL